MSLASLDPPYRLSWACLACCAVFLLTAGVLQFLRTDLQPLQHTLSFYLHGPGGLWLCLSYVLLGTAMVGLGWLLYRFVPGPSLAGGAVLVLLTISGSCLAAVALGDRMFPPDQLERPGMFHQVAAYASFACALLITLLQTVRFACHAQWRSWAWPAGLGTVLCWSLAVIHIGQLDWLPRGGGQKLLIATLVCWMLLAAAAVLWQSAAMAAGSNAAVRADPPHDGTENHDSTL